MKQAKRVRRRTKHNREMSETGKGCKDGLVQATNQPLRGIGYNQLLLSQCVLGVFRELVVGKFAWAIVMVSTVSLVGPLAAYQAQMQTIFSKAVVGIGQSGG